MDTHSIWIHTMCPDSIRSDGRCGMLVMYVMYAPTLPSDRLFIYVMLVIMHAIKAALPLVECVGP